MINQVNFFRAHQKADRKLRPHPHQQKSLVKSMRLQHPHHIKEAANVNPDQRAKAASPLT